MDFNSRSEETLKVDIYREYFGEYEYETLGKIDFAIYAPFDDRNDYLLWAEAKKGSTHDIYESFVQLILTIGKERTFARCQPPRYVGAFDAEKIAFIEYSDILHIFSQNDFDWNVTPSDHSSKEFRQLFETVKGTLEEKKFLYKYEGQDGELREFIRENFVVGKEGTQKMQVDKNNFVHVFNQWLREVKPTIQINWEKANARGIVEADFFLADLMSEDNNTLFDNLYVVLRHRHYELDRLIDEDGLFSSKKAEFNDGQKAHTAFWNRYERPPKKEYQKYILDRRDLLVPDDKRKRSGAFYTPEILVEKSQAYIVEELGKDWQDEYYVWDCCAGTGNMLVGLTNKHNIFASTLEKQDVDVMRETLVERGALLNGHVFQFDFLNDSFDDKKVPEDLRKILSDPEKIKRLVIYINPPYAEATSKGTIIDTDKNKPGTAKDHKVYTTYKHLVGKAGYELFAQFYTRIYLELRGCTMGVFSKIKHLQGENFASFREMFKAEFKRGFIIPADIFDNVTGKFPIAFLVWDTKKEEVFTKCKLDVFTIRGKEETAKAIAGGKKTVRATRRPSINAWIKKYLDGKSEAKAYMGTPAPDFGNTTDSYITSNKGTRHFVYFDFTPRNLVYGVVYFAVRMCIKQNWLNDRDQFLQPKKTWQKDIEFRNNCLAFTLFHGQNRISIKQGANHWIPFTEKEVDAQGLFDSRFMSDFIRGKVKEEESLIKDDEKKYEPIVFSEKAQAVMDAGRELWRYYHRQTGANPNASYYDIKAHFQGVNENGKMNGTSEDGEYNRLHGELKEAMKALGKEIEGKVYEYEFLLG